MIPSCPYGNTGIRVSALGLGAGQIGDARLDEAVVAELLNTAVDAGISLIDTARGYGLSEERIGRHLGARRDEIVLSTKVGYGIEGEKDWTGACITAGIEAALRRLKTDRIDIVHLHSCPWETLARGEVIAALETAKAAGKLRAIAYSGENEDLAWALESGRFDGFMASLNLCDQRVIETVLPRLAGRGFIAKRAMANHPWRFTEQPRGDYSEVYWLRMREMALPDFGHPRDELALRFAVFQPGVSSAIIGTSKTPHLLHDLGLIDAGPLPAYWVGLLRAGFVEHDRNWRGQI